jgi:Xaa-Pro dipeptidase
MKRNQKGNIVMPINQTRTPRSELQNRWGKLQKHMVEQDVDGALILQNADLFYFSGTVQQSNLYIPAEGEPILMIRKDVDRGKDESALPRVVPFTSPREIPGILEDHGLSAPGRMGMELDVIPANQYFSFSKLFEKTVITDISMPIRLTRSIKSDYEIDLIRKSAEMSDRLAAEVPSIIKEGMTEVELAGLIEATARKWGHQGITRMRLFGSELFYGHVMAGPAAARPSFLSSPTGGAGLNPSVGQGSSMRPILRNEPVLVDVVFALDGYLSDHARIFCIGDLPNDLLSAHDAMLEIQNTIKKAAVPGVSAGSLYDLAVSKAEAFGLGDHFMGVGPQRIRFIGHGVGVEVDEFPILAKGQKMTLEKGMTIALEPKAIFPGKGVVGVENTHVVMENGLEQLGTFNEKIIRC